jgi:hypothetical protein
METPEVSRLGPPPLLDRQIASAEHDQFSIFTRNIPQATANRWLLALAGVFLASGFVLLVAGSILLVATGSVSLSLVSAFLGCSLILGAFYLGLVVWIIGPIFKRIRSSVPFYFASENPPAFPSSMLDP